MRAPVQDGQQRYRPEKGTPQGGVLSPWLANVYLHRLDTAFADLDVRVVRYADDALLMSRTPSGAQKALERAKEVEQRIETRQGDLGELRSLLLARRRASGTGRPSRASTGD